MKTSVTRTIERKVPFLGNIKVKVFVKVDGDKVDLDVAMKYKRNWFYIGGFEIYIKGNEG